MEKKEHYGLGTAISMIMGIVIGSGIFFKVDDILIKTGGNIALGILVFILGAFCVVFGSISLSQLASRTQKKGGLISYFEEFVSIESANAIGWFQVYVYLPTLSAVVSWVAGIYTISLLGLPDNLEMKIIVGLIYMTFFYALNYFSYQIGGRFQNISTIAKMIPLIGIGLLGLFWKSPYPTVPVEMVLVKQHSVGWGWLAALAPMAFSFDGWIVSTTITQEVRDYKRNMPIALTVGPLLVLGVYLTFFLGVISIIGPEYILSAGDATVSQLGHSIFGPMGETILLVFVLLAVLGVLNGLTLGYVRMPQILATKNMLPYSEKLAKINPKTELSPYSAILAYCISLIWLLVHYITQKWDLLNGGDISEIAIVFSYLSYMILYFKVIQLNRDGIIENKFLGKIAPILGICGSLIIFIGGLFANPVYGPIFILISGLICWLGYFYTKENNQ